MRGIAFAQRGERHVYTEVGQQRLLLLLLLPLPLLLQQFAKPALLLSSMNTSWSGRPFPSGLKMEQFNSAGRANITELNRRAARPQSR